MSNVAIDLSEPFEKILATVLSLPAGCSDANEAQIKEVIRGLYEAANGRHVETKVGLIAIAPPAYAFLKAKPFRVTTQMDLLIEAAARLIGGSEIGEGRAELPKAGADIKRRYKMSTDYRATYRTRFPFVSNASAAL